MPSFQFPDPSLEQTVVNPITGSTYQWKEPPGKWVLTSTLVDSDIEDRVDALENAPAPTADVQLSVVYDQEKCHIKVNGDAEKGTELKAATYYSAGVLGQADYRRLETWDAKNYYTKEYIDNQVSMRGVGYDYSLSNTNGTVTIRPGEFHTNNRIAGQITYISIAPVDNKDKSRRDAIVGDTIELLDTLTQKYYRYQITAMVVDSFEVTYKGSVENRDDPFGIGYPFVIYIYPTHISPTSYATIDYVDSALENVSPSMDGGCVCIESDQSNVTPYVTFKDNEGNHDFEVKKGEVRIGKQSSTILIADNEIKSGKSIEVKKKNHTHDGDNCFIAHQGQVQVIDVGFECIDTAGHTNFKARTNGQVEVRDGYVPASDNALVNKHYVDQQIQAARSVESEVDQNEEQLQAVSTSVFNLINKVDELHELDLDTALSALAQARQDIIELKSKVNSLEHTLFLILE